MPLRTWFAIGAVVLACTGCADPGTPNGPRIDSAQLTAEVESLWTPGEGGAGGYATTDTLDAAPALYATAWSLRLARSLRQTPAGLSVPATAAWLRRRLAVPESAGDPPDSLPPLYRAWLAARALADLGQPLPQGAVAAALSAYGPSKGMYRIDGRQAPSWGATRLAVEIRRLAHLDVPSDTVRAVSSELRSSLRSGAPNLDIDEFIPVWSLADDLVPAGDRAPLRITLLSRLGETSRRLTSNPASGETLDVALDVVAIAAANSLPPPAFDVPALVAPIRKANGYLSMSSGADSAGDPQVTYYAVALGMPVTATLRAALETHLMPSGWRVDAGPIDPVVSFYCEAILEGLGIRHHRAAMAAQAASWLRASSSNASANTATDKRTYFAVSLARLTGATVPESLAAALTQRLATLDATANLDDVWLLGLVDTLSLRLPETIVARLAGAAELPTASLHDLDLHLLVQELLSQPHTIPPGSWWARFRIGSEYRRSPGAQEPDLLSTAFAARALNLSSSERARMLSDFIGQGRVFYAPATLREASGNNAPPQAAYLGLCLLGTIQDDSGIHV